MCGAQRFTEEGERMLVLHEYGANAQVAGVSFHNKLFLKIREL
jgi:hypothetical protein